MTENNEYDFKPSEKKPRPKPGDPDFVPPIPIIEPPDPPEPAERATEPEEPPPDPDIEKNKVMAILAYILFLIPLLAAPNSKFARFHANQGLLTFCLWCISIAISFILEFTWAYIGARVPGVVWFFCGFVVTVLPIALFLTTIAFSIVGIVNAVNGEKKPLPLVGHWNLIK